jgi:hypothetical protein
MSTADPNRTRRQRKPARRKNTKVTGEHSEAAFHYKAVHLEFGVARPWGDSLRYDFILDNGARLFRIQVKCTETIRAQAYETRATYTTGKGRAVYTKKDIDFIAAHVVPLDIWYIIPVEVCTPQPMLRFYPHRKAKKMRLEQYREAWHLLQSTEDATHLEIQASADEAIYPLDLPSHVIPSEGAAPRRGSAPQSRACPEPAEGDLGFGFDASAPPIRLPKSAAPWPIPPLKILATRKGKQILPPPPK